MSQGGVTDDGLLPGGVVGLWYRCTVELLWRDVFQRTPVACRVYSRDTGLVRIYINRAKRNMLSQDILLFDFLL